MQTLAQVFKDSSDSDQNDNTCTINAGKETQHESESEQDQSDCHAPGLQLPARYNASCQTRTTVSS